MFKPQVKVVGKTAHGMVAAVLFLILPMSHAESFQSGKAFPSIVLPDLDGKPGSMEGFLGHKVILHIFASW